MKNYPFVFLIIGTIFAMFAALGIVILGLQPPQDEIRVLVQYMLMSGIGTIVVLYLLYKYILANWMNSLRWSLLMIVGMTIALVFLNVLATLQLMYVSNHDLILTAALLVFGGLTALVFGWFIASSISQRLQAISDGIERLAEGDLKVRVPVSGDDEFSKLGKMLNWTVDSLAEIEDEKQRIDETRRDLIAWISHDLRTPLTAVQASLEAIADDIVVEREAVKEYVQNSLTEVDNLKLLIEDLFALAQLDAGHMSLNFMETSLNDLISDTVSGLNAHAQRRQVAIHGEIQANLEPVYIAPDKIQRVMHNLIDNAIRHTPSGGNITISASQKSDSIQVEVHNTGDSIPQEHLPHIFDKFYRGEQARQRDSDGHRGAGLGLAIAQGFIKAHQGNIWVDSSDHRGTCFGFSIPVMQTN